MVSNVRQEEFYSEPLLSSLSYVSIFGHPAWTDPGQPYHAALANLWAFHHRIEEASRKISVADIISGSNDDSNVKLLPYRYQCLDDSDAFAEMDCTFGSHSEHYSELDSFDDAPYEGSRLEVGQIVQQEFEEDLSDVTWDSWLIVFQHLLLDIHHAGMEYMRQEWSSTLINTAAHFLAAVRLNPNISCKIDKEMPFLINYNELKYVPTTHEELLSISQTKLVDSPDDMKLWTELSSAKVRRLWYSKEQTQTTSLLPSPIAYALGKPNRQVTVTNFLRTRKDKEASIGSDDLSSRDRHNDSDESNTSTEEEMLDETMGTNETGSNDDTDTVQNSFTSTTILKACELKSTASEPCWKDQVLKSVQLEYAGTQWNKPIPPISTNKGFPIKPPVYHVSSHIAASVTSIVPGVVQHQSILPLQHSGLYWNKGAVQYAPRQPYRLVPIPYVSYQPMLPRLYSNFMPGVPPLSMHPAPPPPPPPIFMQPPIWRGPRIPCIPSPQAIRHPINQNMVFHESVQAQHWIQRAETLQQTSYQARMRHLNFNVPLVQPYKVGGLAPMISLRCPRPIAQQVLNIQQTVVTPNSQEECPDGDSMKVIDSNPKDRVLSEESSTSKDPSLSSGTYLSTD